MSLAKRTLMTAAWVAVVLTGLPAPGQDRGVLKIGVSTRLSGPSAVIGDSDRKSVTMAVEELNAAGGVAGYRLEAVYADNKGVPSEAVAAARRLADVDQVLAIVDSAGSSGTLAAMPVVKQLGLVNLAKTSTNPRIYGMSGVGGNEWAFRLNIDDTLIAQTYAGFIAQGVRSVAVLAYNDDYGRGAAAAYQPLLEKLQVKVTSTDFFPRGTADYRPLLTRVRQASPEGVLYVGTATDAAVFARQLREVGWKPQVFCRGDIASPEFLRAVGDDPSLVEGWTDATLWAPSADEAFVARYTARWSSPAVSHGAMGYHAVKDVLAAAIARAQADAGKVTRESLRDALGKISVETTLGTIRFDDHNQAYPNLFIVQMQQGQAKVLRAIAPTPPGK
jgi:branched-chain amino acid transport system substrate-binding protein